MSLDSGSTDSTVGRQPRAVRGGWGFLTIATLSRAYLVLMLALGACATLPMLTGLTGSIVQSGSMEPLISTGDVVLSEPMEADTPPPLGRVVSFPAPAGSATAGTMLHRVVGANEDGSLITAGDANQSVDSSPLDRGDIISQAQLLIPWIGLPAFWLTTTAITPLVLWLILTAAAVVVVALDGAANPRPRRPRGRHFRPSRQGRGPRVAPAELAAVGVVATLIAVTLVAAPPTEVTAAFSASTTMAGSSWETAGPATQLAFTTAPSGSTGGVAWARQPVVAIQNAEGETASSTASVALTLTNPAGATLACAANPVAAVSGRASFAGCRIDRAGTYTLTARSGALPAALSATFTITTGPASKLVFTAQPGSTSVDTAFAVQPILAIQDAGGNTVSSTAAVTLGLTSAAGAGLTCTANPRAAVAGTATFAGCKITKPGSYSLTATAAGLTAAVSGSVAISAGPAARLVFTTSPSGSTGGRAFGTQPVVAVRDAGGNAVATTMPVTLAITTAAGATLACSANPATGTGTVAFAGCSIGRAGTYTLTASSGTLTAAVSASFTIAVGPATKLGFTSAPSTTRYNTTFDTQPAVAIQDAGGNTVASTAAVTLKLTTAAGATLYCTANPKAAASGVATYSGCRIDKAGSYTLTATSGVLTPAVSGSYTVTPGPAAKLAFSVNPGGSTGGVAFSGQPTVVVQDAGGNIATGTTPVTLSLTTANGATLTCTTNPLSPLSGAAAFAGCAVDRAGSYTLRAVSGNLTAATSASFTVATGPAARLVFVSSPGSTTSATTFGNTPAVTVQDAGGNAVTATGQATLALTNAAGATLACATNPAPSYVGWGFIFSGCSIDKAGTYTLTATAGTLTTVSPAFTVTPGAASKLVFVAAGSGGSVNQVWGTQPSVAIQDASGNVVASSASVTVRLTTPAGATLTCTSNPRAAVSGVATFAGCRVNRAGSYTLTATSGTLAAGVSPGVTIAP
ncbi:hypothetical protein B7495_09685 [Cryobacterium sp. LW097]|uniref:hypothetical protein n=1 Tax=Cryobacterium sp. LW097 TaxID=1978566 RepID=UPI000B4D7D37|nr:hypothetical protein [Cryobacterium sp. LW097]ASD22324.1 hypothetical protein B7495_09685 [Cryobacterium sp. LW097]